MPAHKLTSFSAVSNHFSKVVACHPVCSIPDFGVVLNKAALQLGHASCSSPAHKPALLFRGIELVLQGGAGLPCSGAATGTSWATARTTTGRVIVAAAGNALHLMGGHAG